MQPLRTRVGRAVSQVADLPGWAARGTAEGVPAWRGLHARGHQTQGCTDAPTAGAPGEGWSLCLEIPTAVPWNLRDFPGGGGNHRASQQRSHLRKGSVREYRVHLRSVLSGSVLTGVKGLRGSSLMAQDTRGDSRSQGWSTKNVMASEHGDRNGPGSGDTARAGRRAQVVADLTRGTMQHPALPSHTWPPCPQGPARTAAPPAGSRRVTSTETSST